MLSGAGSGTRSATGTRSPAARWAGYAAAAWAFVFAVPSFYWGAGGTVGLDATLSPAIAQLAQERVPWVIAAVWITGALKVVGGPLALALVQPWGRVIPDWMLLTLAWGGGVLVAVHGAAFMVAGALVEGGVVALPGPALLTTIRWYALLWGPWFLVGGILFLVAAWFHLRTLPERRAEVVFSALGVVGGLAVSVALLVFGIG